MPHAIATALDARARAWALDEAATLRPGADLDVDVWRGHLCWMLALTPDPDRPVLQRFQRLADAADAPDEACVRAAVRDALSG